MFNPFIALRLQRGAQHRHDLGTRALAGFPDDLSNRIGGMPTIIGLLNRTPAHHAGHDTGRRRRSVSGAAAACGDTVNAIKSDADLLATCRERQIIIDELKAERELASQFQALRAGMDDEFAYVSDAWCRQDRLPKRLEELTRAIAAAVISHLLNPPPPKDEIAVLPRRPR